VRGLARIARGNAEALQLGMIQWGEHDMSHSSVERVALPDLLHLVVAALSRTAALVSGLSWEEPTLPEDYQDSAAILRGLQASGTPYVEAHGQLTAFYRDGKIPDTTTEGDR
jgi:adenylosuccinate lyase